MTNENDAVDCEHVDFIKDWNPFTSCTIRTRWFNTRRQAKKAAKEYQDAGHGWVCVFDEPHSCLGRFRVVAHQYHNHTKIG